MTDVEMIDTSKASEKKEEQPAAPEEPQEPTDQFYGKSFAFKPNQVDRAEEVLRIA